MIGALIEEAKQTYESLAHENKSAQRLDESLINRSSQKVAEIVDELQDIFNGCTDRTDDKKWKVRKLKWIQKEGKIEKLCQKAESAKSNLHLAMVNQVNQQLVINKKEMAMMGLKQDAYVSSYAGSTLGLALRPISVADMADRNNMEMLRRFDLLLVYKPQPSPLGTSPRIKELLSPSPEQKDDSVDVMVGQKIKSTFNPRLCGENQRVRSSARATGLQPGRDSQDETSAGISSTEHCSTCKKYASFSQCQNILPIRRCKLLDCRCQCHFGQRRFQTPGWLQPLVGSWLVSYNHIYGIGKAKCNQKGCKRGDDPYIRLEYRLSKRILTGLLSFQASYGYVTSLGFSLRPARVISGHDDVWQRLRRVQSLHSLIQEGAAYFPDDQRDDGWGLLEVSIVYDLGTGQLTAVCSVVCY